MLWLLATDPDPDNAGPPLDRLGALVPAYRSHATLAPWWQTSLPRWRGRLACRVTPLYLPATDSQQWRKAVRTSQFRKLEPRGATAGVRVLDVATRWAAPPTGTAANGGSPATHRRRRNWHRVRVRPRGSWRREWRWYHDVVVNPDGRVDTRPRVYRLPTPAEAPTPQGTAPSLIPPESADGHH